MRTIALAMFVVIAPALAACHQQQTFGYSSADANEDAALNTLQSENNEAEGAGYAVSGMIPAANGQRPMANVQ
jgi:hypothetical protein